MASKHRNMALIAALMMALTTGLSGCAMFGGGGSASTASTQSQAVGNVIELGKEYQLFNNSVKMTVLSVQRRPLSHFLGGTDISSERNITSDMDIVVEVDVALRYNQNVLTTSIGQLGGALPDENSYPDTLMSLLQPGSLLYLSGTDQDGYPYTSASVLAGPTSTDNTLGTNAQWDYNMMSSPLPQSTTEKRGSILLLSTSSVRDMSVMIASPTSCPNPLNPEAVMSDPSTILYSIPVN